MLAIATLLPIVLERPATACSCRQADDAGSFASADAVFLGRVVDERVPRAPESSADPRLWVFEVETVYKGNVAARQGVVTTMGGASCGLELDMSGRFLVFATTEGFPDVRGANLYSYLCMGTRRAGDESAASFGAGHEPSAGTAGIAAVNTAGWGRWLTWVAAVGVVLVTTACIGLAVRRRVLWTKNPTTAA